MEKLSKLFLVIFLGLLTFAAMAETDVVENEIDRVYLNISAGVYLNQDEGLDVQIDGQVYFTLDECLIDSMINGSSGNIGLNCVEILIKEYDDEQNTTY